MDNTDRQQRIEMLRRTRRRTRKKGMGHKWMGVHRSEVAMWKELVADAGVEEFEVFADPLAEVDRRGPRFYDHPPEEAVEETREDEDLTPVSDVPHQGSVAEGRAHGDQDAARNLARELTDLAAQLDSLKREAVARISHEGYYSLRHRLEDAHASVEAAAVEARRRVELNEER